jgi:hypothetical protein
MALSIGSILIFVLVIPIILGIVKMVKEGVTFMSVASLLFSVAIFGFGFMLQLDSSDFQENFETSEKTILLNDNGQITAGFIGVLKPEKPPQFLSQATIEEYNTYYQRKDFEKLKGNSYKLMIVQREAFNFLGYVEFGGEDIDLKDVFPIINSPNPISMYADRIVAAGIKSNDIAPEYKDKAKEQYLEEITKAIGGQGELKGSLFGVLISDATKERGPLFLLEAYGNGQMDVYEETFMFKVIAVIPTSVMKWLSNTKIPFMDALVG